MEVLENLPLPAQEVKRDREDGTDQEAPQEGTVEGTSTEHLLVRVRVMPVRDVRI